MPALSPPSAWSYAIAIFYVCGVLLLLFMFCSWMHGASIRYKWYYKAKVDLENDIQKAGSSTDKKFLEGVVARLQTHKVVHSVQDDVMDNLLIPILEHPDTKAVDWLLYHTTIGRVFVQGVDQFIDRVSWLLGLVFMFFVQDFVKYQITQMAVPTNGYVAAMGISALVFFLFNIFVIQSKQYIGHKLGTPGVYDAREGV